MVEEEENMEKSEGKNAYFILRQFKVEVFQILDLIQHRPMENLPEPDVHKQIFNPTVPI